MDASRYDRIRDLFLAAEELPPGDQEAYLRIETAGDVELLEEVVSLLAEHDPQAAQTEGECAQPVSVPPGVSSETSAESSESSFGNSPKPNPFLDLVHQVDPGFATPKADGGDGQGSRGLASGASSEAASLENRGLITKQGALRTHASPRYNDTPRPKSESSKPLPIWAARTRKSRRRTSRWFWLAALLPTALVGLWTYQAVNSTLHRSIEFKLESTVDSLAITVDRFLVDEAALVQSWARQPALRQSIRELIELAGTDPSIETIRQAKQIDQIYDQLRGFSNNEDVKFVVWNANYRILASWQADRADVGSLVDPSGAESLARVMAGESVFFGPERLADNPDASDQQSSDPVMGVIVPVQNTQGKTIAAMSVYGLDTFANFDRIFSRVAVGSGLDAYAVNRDGVMISQSNVAMSLATQGRFDFKPDQIVAGLRVSDPGYRVASYRYEDLNSKSDSVRSISRSICPITVSVAGGISEIPNVRTDSYANYAGDKVVGAWRFLSPWQIAIIVEEDAAVAFGPSRLVRFGFLLLGSLLSVTAFLTAAKLARTATAEQAAVHPLARYDVTNELGSGGMGIVYRARHRQLGRDVALKLLRQDRQDKDGRLRFDREAKLAASLSNPHSVMIYDYGHSPSGEAFCVMQFLQGLTLQEVVARSGHQPVGRVLAILRQVCDALAEAHSLNLLHRDIKPQNVMLSLDPSVGDWAVVFDYGLAKPLDPDASVFQTSETVWSGTPMYMAPERFRQPTQSDPRSDLYSVGCVAYYLLAGRPPFIESEPESLFSLILSEQPLGIGIHRGEEIVEEVSNLVLKCMAKNAEDRYESVAALARDVDRIRLAHSWSVDQARVWWSHHGGT